MITICDKRCIIGEGPIWNEKEKNCILPTEWVMRYVG